MVYEDEAVTKAPVEKDRDSGQRVVAVALHKIGADVDFADVELVAPRHAPMALARTHADERDEFDAVCRDLAERDGPREFVITQRNGESDLCHQLAGANWRFGVRRRVARRRSVAAISAAPFAASTTP